MSGATEDRLHDDQTLATRVGERPSSGGHPQPCDDRPTTVTVRPAAPSDEDALAAMFTRAFPRFERLLLTGGGHRLVAEGPDGRLVGAAVLRTADVAGRRIGNVDWIFADPQAGVPGTGTTLLGAALEWFDDQGCSEQVARIEPVNTASQQLHRSAGFAPLSTRDQLRRWSWRLPRLWASMHHGFDPGLRLWVRGAAAPTPPLWSRLGSTVALNVMLLMVITWRAPRELSLTLGGVVSLALIGAGLLGVRELALRLAARRQGLALGHVPWTTGIGVSGVLSVAAGVWFPLLGSSAPEGRWRYERELPRLARAHTVAGAVVGVIALVVVLIPSAPDWVPLADLQRAAVMLALVDLVVPVAPFNGTTARIVAGWSRTRWGALASLAVAALLLSLR